MKTSEIIPHRYGECLVSVGDRFWDDEYLFEVVEFTDRQTYSSLARAHVPTITCQAVSLPRFGPVRYLSMGKNGQIDFCGDFVALMVHQRKHGLSYGKPAT